MKKFFILLVAVLALNTCFSQTGDSQKGRGFRKGNIFHKDSIAVKLKNLKDSVDKTLQEVRGQDDIGKNVEELLKSLEEKRKKEKSKAILYIVFGAGLLVVLVIGLLRKRVKK